MTAQQPVWLPVPHWPNYETAPASGRVRSLDHTVVDQLGRKRRIHGRVLAVADGRVCLCHGPRRRTMSVSRVVAAAVAAAQVGA